MKRTLQICVTVAALLVAVPLLIEGLKPGALTASAMPAWSRKYNADCTLCHTTYPRLNRTGYEFKRLGYRFPSEVAARGGAKDSAARRAGGGRTGEGATDSAAARSAVTYMPSPVTESSRAGERLYKELNCAACHAIAAAGSEAGPRLDGIGARRSRAFIVAHVKDPEAHARSLPAEFPQGVTMPPTAVTQEQLAQLADYLLTLPAAQVSELPKARLRDYVAVSYLPGVEFESAGGETERTFEKRDLVVYAAGTAGRNFSFFIQPTPLSEEKGFLKKFEMMQGLFNSGGARNFVQVRFGQIFNLRNAGFGGTDRGLTETLPFVFQPVNGFNPSGLGRGASVEYTAGRSATFKAFANSNEAAEAEGGGGVTPGLSRSHAYGFAYEQVLGRRGLSGVQFQFAGGSTPLSLDGVRQPSLRFQRYSFFANKTFQDRKNFERVNAIFGLSLLRDDRFLGIDEAGRSRGYGYFLELDTNPVAKRLSLFGRYDRLRPTTLVADNRLRGGTFGVIYDPVKYARVSFEYQRLEAAQAVNRYRIGFQLNY